MYPSSRRPCRNASMRVGLEEGEIPPRYPIRGTFVGCCADADKQSPKNMAHITRPTTFLLIAFPADCHLVTWFARARNSGESVRPICLAAFRLITNSNFVACCTGKSAGLA